MPIRPERAETLQRIFEADAGRRPAAAGAPFVVIDTNVLLDMFHWRDPGAAELQSLIAAGRLQPVRDEATLCELAEVMDRSTFRIPFDEATRSLEAWSRSALPLSALQGMPGRADDAPRCRDPLDQKFLDLALAAGAAMLVTKDKLVLKTRRKMALRGCAVVRPEDAGSALEAILQPKK